MPKRAARPQAGCRELEGPCGAAQSVCCLLSPSSGFPAGQRGAPTLPHAAPEWGLCPASHSPAPHTPPCPTAGCQGCTLPPLKGMSSPPGEARLLASPTLLQNAPPCNSAEPKNWPRKGETLHFSKRLGKALERFLVKIIGSGSVSTAEIWVRSWGVLRVTSTLSRPVRVPRQAGAAGRAPCPRRVPLVGTARRGGPGRHGLADGAGSPGAAGRHARLLQPLHPTERPLRGGSRRGPVRPGKPQCRAQSCSVLGSRGDRGEGLAGGCPSRYFPMGGGELMSRCCAP